MKISLLEKLGTWNRLIIEYTQAQPLNSAGAYYSLRIFIGSSSTSRIYFADSAGTASPPALFFGVTNMVLDFCSKVMDGTTPTTRETNKDGNFDVLNFLWFAGPGGVYQNTSGTNNSRLSSYNFLYLIADPNCLQTAFLYSNQRSCLLCATGYYLYNKACYATCPADTLPHEDTKSCQSKY